MVFFSRFRSSFPRAPLWSRNTNVKESWKPGFRSRSAAGRRRHLTPVARPWEAFAGGLEASADLERLPRPFRSACHMAGGVHFHLAGSQASSVAARLKIAQIRLAQCDLLRSNRACGDPSITEKLRSSATHENGNLSWLMGLETASAILQKTDLERCF